MGTAFLIVALTVRSIRGSFDGPLLRGGHVVRRLSVPRTPAKLSSPSLSRSDKPSSFSPALQSWRACFRTRAMSSSLSSSSCSSGPVGRTPRPPGRVQCSQAACRSGPHGALAHRQFQTKYISSRQVSKGQEIVAPLSSEGGGGVPG